MNEILEQSRFTSEAVDLGEQQIKKKNRPAVLLHSCCGPCSTTAVDQLINDYELTVFFYNPNITNSEEYFRRKSAQKSFIEKYNMNPERKGYVRFLEGYYNPERFYSAVKGFEDREEGGLRCSICFRLRLEETAYKAILSGFDFFSTTLSVSPHKNFKLISKIGNELSMISGLPYLARDFKKNNGFNRSIELSKKYELYRQNYCGCEFSK